MLTNDRSETLTIEEYDTTNMSLTTETAISNSRITILMNQEFSVTYGQPELDVFSYFCIYERTVMKCR